MVAFRSLAIFPPMASSVSGFSPRRRAIFTISSSEGGAKMLRSIFDR